jgi:hypothetical protein
MMAWPRTAAFLLLAATLPIHAFRISKADFPKFAGSIACDWDGEACPGASRGFAMQGRLGEEIPEASAPELASGGKVLVGFAEGKPFSWARYSVDFPGPRTKWVVLNELSTGDRNHVFLTQWKAIGDSLEFVKIHPQSLPLDLGETYVFAKSTLPDKSLLVILKGEGADAGVGLQDFRFFRLRSPDKIEEVARETNRSEIPVNEILERINADQPVEAVLDSSLTCEIAKGRKAPSGGPLIRLIKLRTRVLYTKNGPEETPAGRDTTILDIWKRVKSRN